MSLRYLSLTEFRNFNSVDLKFSADINFITGKNGSGKTSILEAIFLLSTGRSFRATNLNRLINFDSSNTVVFAEVEDSNALTHKIGYKRDTASNKTLKLDNTEISSVTEVAAILPICCIEGIGFRALLESPQFRRRIFDWGVFHVEHDFYAKWQRYNKILKQRNVYLKQHKSMKHYDTWDVLFAKAAIELIEVRARYFDGVQPYFKQYLHALFAGAIEVDLVIKHGLSTQNEQGVLAELKANLGKDMLRGHTSIGPHKADLIFKFKDVQAKDGLSRGQQKLVIIALYLAQLAHLKHEANRKCLVLIDDLSSELDSFAQQILYTELKKIQHQVIITTIELPVLKELETLINTSNVIDITQYNVSRETNKMV